jgi:hypothetical protein
MRVYITYSDRHVSIYIISVWSMKVSDKSPVSVGMTVLYVSHYYLTLRKRLSILESNNPK